jgi:hypothetical protein
MPLRLADRHHAPGMKPAGQLGKWSSVELLDGVLMTPSSRCDHVDLPPAPRKLGVGKLVDGQNSGVADYEQGMPAPRFTHR